MELQISDDCRAFMIKIDDLLKMAKEEDQAAVARTLKRICVVHNWRMFEEQLNEALQALEKR